MNSDNENNIETVGGISVRSERIEFDAADLIPCGSCGRANAPNRSECIYCGKMLANLASRSEIKPRDLEAWEKGFNIVVLNFPPELEDCEPLPIDRGLMLRAGEIGPPLPVLRTASEGAAAMAAERMAGVGALCLVVGDEELEGDRPPMRLRSITIEGNTFVLTDFNTPGKVTFIMDSLELIVSGRIFEERSEQMIRKDKKGVTELDRGSTMKDSGVVDLYFAGDRRTFRIEETGFDFSFLGPDKSNLAAENIKTLIERLREASPSAKFSDDYFKKKGFIAEIWPAGSRNDSKGVKRWNLGRSIANATVTSNREQFTKYSRLLRRTI